MKHSTGILLLLLAAVLPGCSQSEATPKENTAAKQAIEVELASAARSRIDASLNLVGTLIPIRVTTIVSDVDGIIESFPNSERQLQLSAEGGNIAVPLGLDIGHKVKKGDVLVQINPVDFQLAVDIAQANLDLARRDLENLKAWKRGEEIEQLAAALDQAQAAYDLEKIELLRSDQVLAKRAISQGEHDAAVMAERSAAAALRQAKAAYNLAKAGPTKEQLAVAESRIDTAAAEVALRQEKLNKSTIRAPYDAVIADRYVDVGDRVTAMPRVEIMQIIDPRVLFAQVSVPERYQGRIRLDDIATVTCDGVDRAVPARVELINSMIDLETRTFRVRLTVDNRADTFKAGGFVNASLPVGSACEVVVVPRSAVTFSGGSPAVFVYQDGKVGKTPVKLGMSNENEYEVCEGLEPGQQVVVGNTLVLTDGMAVTPKTANGAGSEKIAGVQR